jgi:hypothetical protein
MQIAADVYRSLPADERAEIALAIAAKVGVLRLGNRAEPAYLTAELTARQAVFSGRVEARSEAMTPHPS